MMFYKMRQYLSVDDEEVLNWVKNLETTRNEIRNLKSLVDNFSEHDLMLTRILAEEANFHADHSKPAL